MKRQNKKPLLFLELKKSAHFKSKLEMRRKCKK
jgi:hypothetical protein